MNRLQKASERRRQNPAYCQVFEGLDEVLVENYRSDNFEKLRLLRSGGRCGDVARLKQYGTVVFPKQNHGA